MLGDREINHHNNNSKGRRMTMTMMILILIFMIKRKEKYSLGMSGGENQMNSGMCIPLFDMVYIDQP